MVESTSPLSPRTGSVQKRGRARRQAILDAAESLLATEGYDATTLKAIGDAAGIPTASMYHYFSDRHQVELELLERHVENLDAFVTANASLPEEPTIADIVAAVIDPMVNYIRLHPSSFELWFNHRNAALTKLVQAYDAATAQQIWELLLAHSLIAQDTPLSVLRLAFEAGNRLFDVAFRLDPSGDEHAISEAKRMMTAYLETYAPA